MNIQALATDYDETVAEQGYIPAPVLAALARFRASGRKLILNTGRMLTDLLPVCPNPEIFDLAILENGGVLYRPSTREEVPLAPAPPQEFLMALRRRGVPVLVGRVAVESSVSHRQAILTSVRDSGVPRDFTFNKSSIIILPPQVDKASGLRVALNELGIDWRHTVGIGDAENDHALLRACGLAVAVPHATAALKRDAHEIMGPIELIDKILSDSLVP